MAAQPYLSALTAAAVKEPDVVVRKTLEAAIATIQSHTTVVRVLLRVALIVLTLGLVSYAAGVLAYLAALWLIFGQTAAGDLRAVVYWSGILYVPFVMFILWPMLLSLGARFTDALRFVVFPAAGAAAGLIPVVVFGGVWQARTVMSPEALLFATLFSTASTLFGIGYALAWRWVHE